MIGSLNGTTAEGWLEFARLIERAGADALELNFYHVATDPFEDARSVERRVVDIVAVLKESIAIPIAVKLSPFYSALPHLAAQLDRIGADGLVLFNRFYQPDIDPLTLETVPQLHLSDSSELLLRLRWLAILDGRLRGSLAVSGGVHEPIDAVKAIMAGADGVQIVSALLKRGPGVPPADHRRIPGMGRRARVRVARPDARQHEPRALPGPGGVRARQLRAHPAILAARARRHRARRPWSPDMIPLTSMPRLH